MQTASRRKWLALVAAYLLAVQSVLSALAGASHIERQIERMLLADGQWLCLSGHADSSPDQPAPVHGSDCCTWACNTGTSLAAAPGGIEFVAPQSFAVALVAADISVAAPSFGHVPFNPRAPPRAA